METNKKAILIKTDGYSIDNSFFNSIEEAKAAMVSQYEALMPEELMEEFEDMCYCGEYTAALYRNGEDVYVWQICVIAENETDAITIAGGPQNATEVSVVRTINGKECSIALTPAEIEKAFRYQDRGYMKEDAKRHLLSLYLDDEEDNEELKEEFKERFGFAFDDIYNDEGHLNVLVERFEDEQDCNCAENDTWDNLIEEYLNEVKSYEEGKR